MFDRMFLMAGNYESRVVGRWDNEDGSQMVSTAAVTDGNRPYETAFQHPEYNDGKMVIVQAYSTKKDALVGHQKWLKTMTDGPLPDALVDCNNSGVSQLCSAFGCDGTFPRQVRS